MEKTTACIASIPERKEMLIETIKSLLPQVDKIELCLNNYEVSVAEEIKALSPDKIGYVISDNKYGDAGKFFWTDVLFGYILTCDDDIIYEKNYVRTMKEGIEKYNRKAVVSCHGRVLDFPLKKSYYHEAIYYFQFNKELNKDMECHVVGTGCMAWHSDTLKISFNFSNFPSKNMADIHFAIFAKKHKIPTIVIAHGSRLMRYMQPEKTIYLEMSKDESEIIQRLNDAMPWFAPKTN